MNKQKLVNIASLAIAIAFLLLASFNRNPSLMAVGVLMIFISVNKIRKTKNDKK